MECGGVVHLILWHFILLNEYIHSQSVVVDVYIHNMIIFTMQLIGRESYSYEYHERLSSSILHCKSFVLK